MDSGKAVPFLYYEFSQISYWWYCCAKLQTTIKTAIHYFNFYDSAVRLPLPVDNFLTEATPVAAVTWYKTFRFALYWFLYEAIE